MSKTRITSNDSEFGSLVSEGVVGRVHSGEDRVQIAGGIADVDGTQMRPRSVRMPEDMIAELDTLDHPGGFSGAVREAVAEWLARRTGAVPRDDAEQALEVLKRFVRAA